MRIRSSLFLAAAILAPLTTQATGVQAVIDGRIIVFSDVQQSTWFAPYVRQAAEAGIVSGYRDAQGNPLGRFKPSNEITVAEALKIVVEGAGYDEGIYASRISSGVRHWASAYVSVAKAEHFPVIADRVRLDRPATRAEVAALLAAAFRVPTQGLVTDTRYRDVKSEMAYAPAIEALSQADIVSGDTDENGLPAGTFRPYDPINRAEVAKMIIEARTSYRKPGEGRMPTEQTSSSIGAGNTVTLYQGGFSPSVLHIRRGESVEFINASSTDLWVKGDSTASLTDFNQGHIAAAGETYVYTFTTLGTYTYYNRSNPAQKGSIIVE